MDAPTPNGTVTTLAYDVVDAELSKMLHSIVMISNSPSNALHIYDVTTSVDRTVPLPATPVAVAVDKTGTMAAVAYDAHVSWVDLTAATLGSTCALSSNAFDVALSSTGIAYVVPRTDQWVQLHAVNLSTCAESLSTGNTWAGSHITMHPSEDAVFLADNGLSPSRIYRCNTTVTPIACMDAQNNADWGTYAYCGDLWSSADGTRIYSACGVTLTLPTSVNSGPATYGGTLQGETFIQNVDEAPDAGRVVTLPRMIPWSFVDAGTDTAVNLHDIAYLGLIGQQPLPPFSGGVAAHGRFAFTDATLSALYVVVENGEGDAGDLFGIATIPM